VNHALDKDLYLSKVFSFTKNKEYLIKVSKNYLNKDDRVLIIDDFLANGKAAIGLTDIVDQAGATVCGIGIVIEKDFQDGGRILRDKGYDVNSLAIIKSLKDGVVEFKEA
jgi:xanthine phosphoribosyltransferase